MDDATQYMAALRALSEQNRMRIVKLLGGGELCACQINEYFKITQPTLSHHMKILCDSGLVLARKEATMIHYRINREMMDRMASCFRTLAGAREGKNEELPRGCCKDARAENALQDGE